MGISQKPCLLTPHPGPPPEVLRLPAGGLPVGQACLPVGRQPDSILLHPDSYRERRLKGVLPTLVRNVSVRPHLSKFFVAEWTLE